MNAKEGFSFDIVFSEERGLATFCVSLISCESLLSSLIFLSLSAFWAKKAAASLEIVLHSHYTQQCKTHQTYNNRYTFTLHLKSNINSNALILRWFNII